MDFVNFITCPHHITSGHCYSLSALNENEWLLVALSPQNTPYFLSHQTELQK